MRTMKNLILPVAAAVCFTVSAFAQNTAAPAPSTTQTKTAKAKIVRFTVVNTTKGPMALRSGDQDMTLAAGQSLEVKAEAGTKIVTTVDSSAGQAGTVVAEVSGDMNGATVNLR